MKNVPAKRRERCAGEAGDFVPVVDRNPCDGSGRCASICPYQVFAIGVLPPAGRQRRGVPQLRVVRVGFPENAIRLVRAPERLAEGGDE